MLLGGIVTYSPSTPAVQEEAKLTMAVAGGKRLGLSSTRMNQALLENLDPGKGLVGKVGHKDGDVAGRVNTYPLAGVRPLL